jgi:phosphoenolpyruvate synthase/pyruvate phosphate dikinase
MHTKTWTKLITRRLAVQVAIAWNYGFGRMFFDRYHAVIPSTLVYYDGKKTDYFVDAKDLDEFNKQLDKNLQNTEFVHSMIPEAKEFVEEKYMFVKDIIKDAPQLSNPRLAMLYTQFSKHHSEYYTRMWMVFRICERIVDKIEAMLKLSGKDELKIKELSRIFSTPLKPNDVTNERIDMLQLALRKAKKEINEEELRKELEIHAEKYRHIPMFDFDHEPFAFEHFASEFEKIKDAETESNKITESFEKRNSEFEKALSELQPNSELNNLIVMLKKAVLLRDYRDMIRQKLNLSVQEFYTVIGARVGLNVEEVALLTNKEIEEYLNASSNFPREEIKNRKTAFLLFQDDNAENTKVEILSGRSAKDKAEQLKLYKSIEIATKIQGIAANTKRTGGIAKIVHTNLDFDKIKDGDIIVASMTRQDFVPHMRKASGIVTNEGGITCHAAIIARELGLPCIVGAENATLHISDGDFIFLDGESGSVEIVKRALREV